MSSLRLPLQVDPVRYLVATHLQVLVVESSSKSVGQVAQVVASVQVAQVSKQSKRYGCGKLPRQSVPETYFFAGHSHRLFAVFSVNCVLMQVAQVVPLVQVAQVAMQSSGVPGVGRTGASVVVDVFSGRALTELVPRVVGECIVRTSLTGGTAGAGCAAPHAS